MTQIKFIRGGSNTILGNFEPGSIARCSDALARHLVAEVGVAEYMQPARVESERQVRRRGRK